MLYNGEGMLKDGKKADLKVIKMEGWKRNMWFDQTSLKWVKTSPNLPYLETAIVYPGTCFFEGVNISEGRGTDRPFQYVGAPWIDNQKALELLRSKNLKGVELKAVEFTPTQRANNAHPPKYNNQVCKGIYLDIKDRNSFEPVKAGISLLWAFKQVNSDSLKWRPQTLDKLAATPKLREMLDLGKSPEEIFASWEGDLKKFQKIRSKYLLYK